MHSGKCIEGMGNSVYMIPYRRYIFINFLKTVFFDILGHDGGSRIVPPQPLAPAQM